MSEPRNPALERKLATRLGLIAAAALALPAATVLALLDTLRRCAPERHCQPDFWLHVALPTAALALFTALFVRRRLIARFRRGE